MEQHELRAPLRCGDSVVTDSGVGIVGTICQAGVLAKRVYCVFVGDVVHEVEWSDEEATSARAAAPATALDAGILALRELESSRDLVGAARFNVRLDCQVSERESPPADRLVRVRVAGRLGGLDVDDVAVAIAVARRHGVDLSVENHGLVLSGFTAGVVAEPGGLAVKICWYDPSTGESLSVVLSTDAAEERALWPDIVVGNAAYKAACVLGAEGQNSAFTLAVGTRILDPNLPLAQLEDREFNLVTLAAP